MSSRALRREESMRQSTVVGAVVAAVVVFLGVLGVAPAQAQKYRLDELVIEQGADTASLDPQVEIDAVSINVNSAIYEPLFRRDASGKVTPHLAESIRMLNDTTWELKLRKGVKFHNGEDFNAETVKFSILRASDKTIKPAPRLGNYYTTFKTVEVLDPHTVHIITAGPDPIVVNRLTGAFGVMVPPNYIKQNGHAILQTKPVGTGPFKFVRWDKDERIVLDAFEGYWGRQAEIRRVVFKPVPEVSARIADLELGRADIVLDIPPDHVPRVSGSRNGRVESVLSSRNIHIILNTVAPGPIASKGVRQALHHAVNVDSIIKNIMGGFGRRTTTLFVPESFGFSTAIKPYPFDPKKAKALLAEAGYPNGFQVDLEFPSGRYLKGEEVAEVIIAQLSEVGITARLQKFEWGTYVKRWRARNFGGLAFIGAGDIMLDADQLLTSRLISDASYGGFYKNPRMDELILQGRKTLNQKERLKIYQEVQEIIREDCPILPLYQQPSIYGVSKRIEWKPNISEEIYVDTVKVVR